MTTCYYDEPSICHGRTWKCRTCGERFCQTHWHETSKGKNVECVACEGARKEREAAHSKQLFVNLIQAAHKSKTLTEAKKQKV